MEITLPPLPYSKDALEPYVSGLTLEVHYEKHQRGYLEKLAKLVEGKSEEHDSLEHLIRTAQGEVYDNAAQVWNHSFYWNSMTPGGSAPSDELRARIEVDFGSVEELQRRLVEAATGQFGSGWAWLVLDGRDRLRVAATGDAGNPLRAGGIPLLTIDVWEHAYYLDYLNDREHYARGVVLNLLDFEFAAENLRRATTVESPEDLPAVAGSDLQGAGRQNDAKERERDEDEESGRRPAGR